MAIFSATGLGQTPGYPSYVVDAQQPVVSSDGFNAPGGVVVAPGGTLYVADSGNHRVLKISPDGTQSAVSFGSLAPAVETPSGVALDANLNLYVTDQATSRLIKIPTPAGTRNPDYTVSRGGPPVTIIKAPLLNEPVSVAADGRGSLLVVNAGNHTVVLRYLGGLPAVLQTGDTKLIAPQAAAFDLDENIYVADGGDGTTGPAVYRFGRQGGTGVNITPAGYALKKVTGLSVDSGGNVFVLDGAEKQLIEIPANGGLAYLVPQSNFVAPSGLTTDNLDNLYVSDSGLTAGTVTKFVYHNAADFGQVKIGALSAPVTFNYEFYEPVTVTATHTMGGGRLNAEYAPAAGGTCFLKAYEPTVSAAGATLPAACTVKVTLKPAYAGGRPGAVQLVTSIGTAQQLTYGLGLGAQLALLNAPVTTKLSSMNIGSVIVNAANTEIYFSDGLKVYKMPVGGQTPTVVTSETGGELALNGAGDLYVLGNTGAPKYKARVLKIPGDGSAPSDVDISALISPMAMVIDPNGALYFTDLNAPGQYNYYTVNGAVRRISEAGAVSRIFPGFWIEPTLFSADGQGNILVEDEPNFGIFGFQARTGAYANLFTQSNYGCIGVGGPYGNQYGPEPQSMASDASGTTYFYDVSDFNVAIESCSNTAVTTPQDFGVMPLYTIPGVLYSSGYLPLPFIPGVGQEAIAIAPNGNLYYTNGTGGGLYVVNRTQGTIPAGAFDPKQYVLGGPTQPGYVYNLGNQNATFTDGSQAFTASGTGLGTFTFSTPAATGGSFPCLAGTVLQPGAFCEFDATDTNAVGAGPVVTDTLHFLTDAVNNDAVTFKVNGPGPAPK